MSGQRLNRRITLVAHPRGLPAPSDFRMDAVPVPEPADGQVLLRTLFLSIDPAAFQRDMSQWVEDGRVVLVEDVTDGLEHAPDALIGVLQGRNFGKAVVRVAA